MAVLDGVTRKNPPASPNTGLKRPKVKLLWSFSVCYRKFFRIHKCVNPKCSFYLQNLKKVDKKHLDDPKEKNKYKRHYIYREFTVDFFRMDLDSLPKNASSLKFSKHNARIMSLCLTLHVNLQPSLRKTARALKDLYGIHISHQQVANYAKTAAIAIKPFVEHYNYPKSSTFVADETYIKIRGIKSYVWFVMDAVSRSILAIRKAFCGLSKLPRRFRFIADGYGTYPLATYFLAREKGSDFLESAENMPKKWQLLIYLGQQTILKLQTENSNCS